MSRDRQVRSDFYRVHWLCWQPTPYNAYLFRELAKHVELVVHYRERLLASHPWQSNFTDGYVADYYRSMLGVDWRVALLPFREPRSFFVVGGWDHPTAWLLLSLLRLSSRRYAIWTDTPNLSRQRNAVKTALRSAWLGWIFRGATAVMGTGRPALDALRRIGARVEQLINFPYFQDLELYRRHLACPGESASLRVLSVGRISNCLKGHDMAVRALAVAKSQDPTIRLRYQIVGAGPDENVLKDLVVRLGLRDEVEILGWQEPETVLKLYESSDILIHPSLEHEPFGVAVVEAMAAGLVVLASDVTGCALDRIRHGVNGFLHRAGDIQELAEQIVYSHRHRGTLREIGLCARRTAEEWPVERGVDLIRRLVDSYAASSILRLGAPI